MDDSGSSSTCTGAESLGIGTHFLGVTGSKFRMSTGLQKREKTERRIVGTLTMIVLEWRDRFRVEGEFE